MCSLTFTLLVSSHSTEDLQLVIVIVMVYIFDFCFKTAEKFDTVVCI